ncbi:MAG: carboxypeptidase regulatory-like domain-containing protein, partial [Planctomycetes bacterium]|nr:carboxypeptidase regulatory-like domain-containing protein [Planctomycetota bacterium]
MDAARTIGIAIILAALDAAFAPALAATAPEDEIPIAGRVLGPDGPVAGAPVGVHLFERGHRDTTTGSDGRFRIALPAGEALLLVGPVPRLGLAQAANRHLRIAGGIPDLEFRLVPGRRVSGILIGEDGMPRGAPGNVMRLSDGANFGLGADPDGRFSGWLPPGEYEIVFFVGEDAGAATEFQIGAEDREDLIVRVMRSLGAEPDPPLALDRISLSPPDSAGFSALRGARGAAPPGHHVVVHLLSVDRIASARADDEGAFEIRLFAPYGSWLQIHVRPTRPGPPGGSEIRTDPRAGPAWVLRHEPRDRHPGDLDGVVPTGAEGAFFTGSIDRLDAAPGEAIRISGRVRMPDPDGRADPRAFATHLRFGLTRLFDETGLELAPVRILASAYLTPTDLPIEGDGPSTCVERGWPLRTGDGLVLRDGVHEGTVRLELAIPDDLPPGWYGVGWGWHIDEGWEGAQAPGFLQEIQHFSLDTLCVIRVGNPGAPALAPLLLPGTVSAGAHGVHPEEARGRWQVSPAAVFAPRTFVAPRCDAGGKPVRYGLEPGLPLVSRANRPFPLSTSAPTIPLRLSGGELRAQLRGPAEFRLQLGPLPIVAGKVGLYGCRPAEVNPARRTRGFPRSFGNNYLAEMLEVSTGDPSFAISFPQPGEYAIEIGGWIDDVHGQRYGIDGRYRLIVGDVLDLDAMTYSGVPFEVGDRWHAGVQVLPPCPADVEVVLRHFPHSDPAQVVERTWRGRANPFGYFDPGEAFRFEAPGEYRADLYVHARSEDGVLRAGSWTSASVVAPVDSPIACRGERGVRSPRSTNRPAWYVEGLSRDIVREPDEGFHAPFPYFPGDVLWLEDGESIFPTVTFIDRDGRWEAILSRLLPDICHGVYSGLFNPDLLPIDRIAIGEIPAVGWGPRPVGQFPRSRRFHGYAYSTTIRPGVAVRSIVQELTPVAYWDLQDPYNLQDGVGPEGDLPGDVKAFFGGVVMRGEGVEGYGVYGSMAVIVPRG